MGWKFPYADYTPTSVIRLLVANLLRRLPNWKRTTRTTRTTKRISLLIESRNRFVIIDFSIEHRATSTVKSSSKKGWSLIRESRCWFVLSYCYVYQSAARICNLRPICGPHLHCAARSSHWVVSLYVFIIDDRFDRLPSFEGYSRDNFSIDKIVKGLCSGCHFPQPDKTSIANFYFCTINTISVNIIFIAKDADDMLRISLPKILTIRLL